jgi:hypothetical protein
VKKLKAHALTVAMAIAFAMVAYGIVHAMIRLEKWLWP